MNAGSRGVLAIEALDPGRRRAQQFRPFADHHDGVEPDDRLEFDDVLAETILAGIHDLFEFRDDRVGEPLLIGNIPTDWPCIQSTSKLSAVSTAVRRSAPVP